MNAREEEALQRKVAAGQISAGEADEDAQAYAEVFRALQKHPEYSLPEDFAFRVVARAHKPKRDFTAFFWYGGGLLFLAMGFWGTMLYAGINLDTGFLNTLHAYREFLVFAACCIAALHALDEKLIRSRMQQHSDLF